MRVVLVHHRDVVEHVLLPLQHAPHAVLQDHRQLVAEAGVVGHAVGDGGEQEEAGTVLVLQAFAGQRGAPRSGAEQEAAAARIGGGPHQIADALEAEAGVEDIGGSMARRAR
jgi:hypothetical protein